MKFAYLIEPPFNLRDADGRVAGCDVELARHVCAELGEDFEPVEAEFAALLPGLASGRWRMTTGLFATDERRASASFSRPIWALADGLLVARGNPGGLTGYRSVARSPGCRLGVIRDQLQHRSAIEFGVPSERITIFETYGKAAQAVADGSIDAYASVARAHHAYLALHPDLACETISVPLAEKPPAFGAFGFAREDEALRQAVDGVLGRYLGTPEHRAMMCCWGFTDGEIDLLLH